MICSSWPVPSVATASAWVSPRVNSARAMRARQHADLGDDRPHRPGVAPVDAQAGVEDGVADDVGLQLLEQRPWPSRRRGPRRPAPSAASCLDGVDLARGAPASGSPRRPRPAARGPARRRARRAPAAPALGSGSVQGSLAARSASSMIAWITGWKLWWPKVTAPSMTSSGSSLRLALHHQHALGGAGDHQVELAGLRAARRSG